MAVDETTVSIKAPEIRYRIADYLRVDGTYSLMGSGFNSIDENYGATESSKAYVNDKTTTTWVTGYEREFAYECDLIISQAPVKALRDVGKLGLTGSDAMFEYVRVDLFNPYSTDSGNTKFYARHFVVSAVPDSDTGEGASEIVHSGTLKAVGDMTEGWFDTSDLSFTAGTTSTTDTTTSTETTETTES